MNHPAHIIYLIKDDYKILKFMQSFFFSVLTSQWHIIVRQKVESQYLQSTIHMQYTHMFLKKCKKYYVTLLLIRRALPPPLSTLTQFDKPWQKQFIF